MGRFRCAGTRSLISPVWPAPAYAYLLLRNDRLWGDTPRPSTESESISDLVLYVALGIVIGGRLGNVLFYDPGYYFAHPLEIVELWDGGIAFHGGLIGAVLAIWYFAKRARVSLLTAADLCAVTAPIGILLVRIANFIKPELWGRPSDVPWAMIFPGVDGQLRHPSQLYEAGLEGLLLFLLLVFFVGRGALKHPAWSPGCSASATAPRGSYVKSFASPTRSSNGCRTD